jgi:hypothetical protein
MPPRRHCTQAFLTLPLHFQYCRFNYSHRTSSSITCNLSLYRPYLAIARLWNTLPGELKDTVLGERCGILRRGSYIGYSGGGAE